MSRKVLDTFDAQILSELQRNARLTAREIAGRIGLSPAACQKRMKRLRASGVIEAEVAIVAPEALGLSVMAIVHVRVARDGREELARFKQLMLAAPEVRQCYYVTGDDNFVVVVALPDMAAYASFSRRHFIENDDVAHFITGMVMERVKHTGRA